MLPNLRAEELDLNNNCVCVIEVLYIQNTILSLLPTEAQATIIALPDNHNNLPTVPLLPRFSLQSLFVIQQASMNAQSPPMPSHNMLE